MDEASDQKDMWVRSAMSEEYVAEMSRRVELFIRKGLKKYTQVVKAAQITVHTISAKCGWAEDEERLVQIIIGKKGGFERLDEVVVEFRIRELPEEVKVILDEMKECNEVDNEFEMLRDGGTDLRKKTLQKLQEWPVPKLNKMAARLLEHLKNEKDENMQEMIKQLLDKCSQQFPETLERVKAQESEEQKQHNEVDAEFEALTNGSTAVR